MAAFALSPAWLATVYVSLLTATFRPQLRLLGAAVPARHSTFNFIDAEEVRHGNVYRHCMQPTCIPQPNNTSGHYCQYHRYPMCFHEAHQPKLPNNGRIFRDTQARVGGDSSGFSGNCSGGGLRPSWCFGETPCFGRWCSLCGRGWSSHLLLRHTF